MSRNPATAEPREPWAVSFSIWGVLGGCLVATVVFLGLTAVMLVLAPPDLVSDLGPAENLSRLFVLVAGVAGAFFLLVGPAVAVGVGWLLRRERNQSAHVLAFTVTGAALGVLVGLPGGIDVSMLLGPMVGGAAGAARMIMSRFALVMNVPRPDAAE